VDAAVLASAGAAAGVLVFSAQESFRERPQPLRSPPHGFKTRATFSTRIYARAEEMEITSPGSQLISTAMGRQQTAQSSMVE
jgi:hypothetical protein